MLKRGLLLLDQVVLKRQRLFLVGDDDVVDVDRFAHQGIGLGVLPSPFAEVGRNPAAQVLGLADIDDLAFGVLVEIHAGGGGQAADFCGKIHLLYSF